MNDILIIGGKEFSNRLFTGTGKFASKKIIPEMLKECGSEMITVALRRVDNSDKDDNILNYIPKNVTLLPNTSGARTRDEAVRIARLAREGGCGDFIKIEVIKDMKYLMPDNYETLKTTEILAKEGFIVLPYMMPDITFTRQLQDAGAAAIMPLGSPIGSNRGLEMIEMIKMIIAEASIPVVVDAGIGRPSEAACAMEIGADAVLVNTAIATSSNPPDIALAFSMAVKAGRKAFLAQMEGKKVFAEASSPLTGFLGGR